ncbi:MAG: TfoX/Sxy family protein [Novosphingobium sp.]|uniref:TfoX/Sxy family protein n=1 Tax=Novosphingobium sp. TaxID=1874826 RepID=UPI0032BB8E02
MTTEQRTVDVLLEQLAAVAGLSARKMFGEYALQFDGKTVALVCDDQLFVKPTAGGRAFIGETDEAPPYPGAKPSLRIDAERWDDADWLCGLLRITIAEVPLPKPKRPKKA